MDYDDKKNYKLIDFFTILIVLIKRV